MKELKKNQPRLRLNRRDVEIFHLLFEYRVLTAEQLSGYYNIPWKRDGGLARRLQRLAQMGYILNPSQAPTAHHYVLGDGGAEILRSEYQNLMPRSGSWDAFGERLRPSAFNEHDKLVVDYMLALEKQNREADEPFLIRRTDILARPNLGARKLPLAWTTELFWNGQYHDVRVCPDWVYGIVDEQGRERVYFLEMDMGTEPQVRNAFDRNQSILRKLLSYAHTYEQKSALEDVGIERFSVVFSVPSERRKANMQKLCEQYLEGMVPKSLVLVYPRDKAGSLPAINVAQA